MLHFFFAPLFMFKKILIANRGEIAVRILRACRELGIQSVAVFSEVDRKSLHVRLADEAYAIGPAPSRESYLRIAKLMDVARLAGCDALHPGYGFLAENPALARACREARVTFIGPPAEAMEALGSKTSGRQLARRVEVPTVPGTNNPTEKSEARVLAQSMGYPALLKAVAVRLARAGGYVNAGTMEFLVDQNLNFYFLEANTRLQVEHPVTEQVTGLDLVKLQIAIAAGHRLPFAWESITPRGHAMEVRLYAEDPDNNFFPSPGRILARQVPSGPGIRLDDGVYEGWTVPNDYDPLLSKLLAWGNSREETIARLRRALEEYIVTGIKTNAGLFRRILDEPDFLRGEIHTKWLDELLSRPRPASSLANNDQRGSAASDAAVIAAAIWQASQSEKQASVSSSADQPSRWKLEGRREQLDRLP